MRILCSNACFDTLCKVTLSNLQSKIEGGRHMVKQNNKILRCVVSVVSSVALALSLCPFGQAFAIDPSGDDLTVATDGSATENPSDLQPDYWVSKYGDNNNDGTDRENPLASLSKAIELCNELEKSDVTICVVGEVVSSSCARITDNAGVDKRVRIVGIEDAKVLRSDNFSTITDTARSEYNPALIEVTSPKFNNVTLTLENITLDDNFLNEGSLFNQASSGENKEGNTDCVQDAIVAGYGTDASNPNVKIILGNDAVLQNFGGMSAVRVTGGASLEMKSGSLITDSRPFDRNKFNNDPHDSIEDDNGAAGAVWVQGTEATMNNGATIDSVTGRAFYIDVQGSVHAAGTVSNMKADVDMWQGFGGVVAHVRDGSKLELQNGFLVSGGNGGSGSAFNVVQTDSRLTMQNGAQITGWSNGNIVLVANTNRIDASDGNQQNSSNNAKTYINGTISGNDTAGSHAVETTNGYVVIGESAQLENNKVNYGTVYIHGGNFVEIHGKIKGNYSTDRGGGVAMTNHGYSRVDMYNRAEITGNYSKETGGGVLVSQGLFCMHGGTISGNYATLEGGGIFVRESGIFEMSGGDISGNYTAKYGGGVAFQPGSSRVSIGGNAKVENNFSGANVTPNEQSGTCSASGGTPNNFAVTRTEDSHYSSSNSHLVVSESVTTSSDDVCISHYRFSFDNLKRNTEIGSASSSCETEATEAYADNSLTEVKGSFWFKSERAAETFRVSGLATNPDKPVYAAVVTTEPDGDPDNSAQVRLVPVARMADETLSFSVDGTADYGQAVVFLQAGDSANANIVAITPADITVYKGGEGGYGAVVGDGGQPQPSASLPTPLFYVDLPETLEGTKAEDIVLKGADSRAWKFKDVGTDASGKSLYLIDSLNGGQDPVRVAFTDDDGKTHKNDDFKVNAVGDLFETYTISIYRGGSGNVTATVDGTTQYDVIAGVGVLTIRAVQSSGPGVVADVVKGAVPSQPLASGTAMAVEPAGTTYALNDTNVLLPEGAAPSLLFDDIIDVDANRTEALLTALKKQGSIGNDVSSQAKYLDLVDANNSNAWITASAGTDVYWGYPEGTDENTEFALYHFEGLHRDGANSGYDVDDIASAKIEPVGIDKTDQGIKFHVDAGGFSPFVLTWETSGGGSVTPPQPQTVTLHYETNGGRPFADETHVLGTKADLKTPLREGCTFAGWYLDEALTKPAEDPLTMDADKTVWAKWESTAVPGGFTSDHVNYVLGRDTDQGRLIMPESNITRAEAAAMFYRLLDEGTRAEYYRESSTFPDVELGAWYEPAVGTLQAMGILRGDDGVGTVRPDDPITRAELAAMAGRFDDDGEWPDMEPFADMDGHWAERIVLVAAENGWVLGDEGSDKFRPDDPITRAETMAIANRVLQRLPEDESDLIAGRVQWPDNQDKEKWYWLVVEEATNNHDHTLKSDGVHERWTALLKNEDWGE